MSFGALSPIFRNINALPRDYNDSLNNFTPSAYPYVYSVLNHSALGLDWSVENQGSSTAVILVDGVEYDIVNGGIESHTNTPFNIIKVLSGSNLYIRIAGITLNSARLLKVI